MNENKVNDIWKDVLEVVKNEMVSISFDTWIRPLIPISMNDHMVRLKANSEFQKNVIIRDKRLLEDAFKYVTGNQYEIEVVLWNKNLIYCSLFKTKNTFYNKKVFLLLGG